VPPTKPSDYNKRNHLRFVHPEDASALVQLAVVDTGETASDDVSIRALRMTFIGLGG